jgi:hypothetical protein
MYNQYTFINNIKHGQLSNNNKCEMGSWGNSKTINKEQIQQTKIHIC